MPVEQTNTEAGVWQKRDVLVSTLCRSQYEGQPRRRLEAEEPTQVLASLSVRWVEQRNKSWTWQHCPMRDQGDHPSQGIKHVSMRFDN